MPFTAPIYRNWSLAWPDLAVLPFSVLNASRLQKAVVAFCFQTGFELVVTGPKEAIEVQCQEQGEKDVGVNDDNLKTGVGASASRQLNHAEKGLGGKLHGNWLDNGRKDAFTDERSCREAQLSDR